ncbi:hypothetical protein GCM10017772_46420 [Promicromonospora soli]|uniref:Uncharacterized protein n=1 Tax=Promicromonospora soli TaxID=2035533 RepID=A0A919L1B0_9MICO|nr:hypothetical protein GCM10017772_46420 [Promicromonospora soli]
MSGWRRKTLIHIHAGQDGSGCRRGVQDMPNATDVVGARAHQPVGNLPIRSVGQRGEEQGPRVRIERAFDPERDGYRAFKVSER